MAHLSYTTLRDTILNCVVKQSRADCEGGIRFITESLASETRADVRDKLAKALRDAERELGENEYEECMEAVEDAREAVGGAQAPASPPR